MKNRHDVVLPQTVETSFGIKAFWHHTPMDCLDDEAKSLREFMKSLQLYCRKEKMCERLRKTDKAHEEWNASVEISRWTD